MNKRILMLAYFVAIVFAAQAQTVIKGNVKEKTATGNLDLPFVNVFVEGTTIGVATGLDGNYEIVVPDERSFTVSYSFMGFKTQSQEIESTGSETFSFDIILEADGETLQEVKVAAKINRESETMLLLEQKKASIAVESIGARELSIKGVSDAGSAVTKVTGISKQEGSGTLNVRGLGDRYNTTTLNRLPLSSNNSEVKNISLELFSTDIIGHIDIEKTYTANLYGDFGGANVNVVSKNLVGDSFFNIGVKSSINSSVIGLDEFYFNDGPKSSGFYSVGQPDIDAIRDRTGYDFPNSWNPNSKSITPNIGFGFDAGKSFDLGTGKLNAFITGAYDNDKVYTEKIERVISATGLPLDDLLGEEYQYKTQTTGMLNLNYSASNTQLYYDVLFLNSSKQSYQSFMGNIRDVNETYNGLRVRGESIRNMIITNQLRGEHDFNNELSLNWGVAYNYVWNTLPDRVENTYLTYDPETNQGEFDTESVGRNYRYAQEFDDNELAANVTIHKIFGEDEEGNYKSKLSVGYSGKYKLREFENIQYNHEVLEANKWWNVQDVNSYFTEENYVSGDIFRVRVPSVNDENFVSQDGEGYNGIVNVQSAYALFDYNIGERLSFLLGLKGENVNQEMKVRSSQFGGVRTFTIEELKALPSLSFKYGLTDKQNLRLATSKTYVMPQLQEMPLMVFQGITDLKWGNPYIKPSDIYNLDLKWEFFPKRGEMFSVTLYGKYILEPMNRFTVAGTQNEYVTANTGEKAHAYGIEFDGKKTLIEQGKNKIFSSGNLSLMATKTDLDGEKIRTETEGYFNAKFDVTEAELQGAAPMLANLSLGYVRRLNNPENSVTAVGVYNYTSRRLYSIGQSGRGHEFDEAFSTLDFVLKSQLGKVRIDFTAKNLLDPSFQRIQENRVVENKDYVVREYKKGVSYQLSVKYRF